MSDLARQQARTVMSLLEVFDRHRRSIGHQATLRTADIRLLWLFTDGQPRTLRQITNELGLEQSTINRQVNSAMQASLITRNRARATDPYLFEPSEFGSSEFSKYLNATTIAYSTALTELGPKSTQLVELMTEFVDLYGKAASPHSHE